MLPIAIARDGDDVLLHGSTGSRWLRLIAQGIPVSLAVTALDALVVARSAFESSMRYRSAVLFGRCQPLAGQDKLAALDVLTDALIPGRVAEVRRPSAKELAATLVLRLGRRGLHDQDCARTGRTIRPRTWPGRPGPGVLPLTSRLRRGAGPPRTCATGIELPASVRRLLA